MRFIPTCVGNTLDQVAQLCIRSVHPHVRGEHFSKRNRLYLAYGSSPRAWGTQELGRRTQTRFRFIPTCVGNTTLAPCALLTETVHPHVRGEHDGLGMNWDEIPGSSPRAWGTPFLTLITMRLFRFIPTCVGNTSLSI